MSSVMGRKPKAATGERRSPTPGTQDSPLEKSEMQHANANPSLKKSDMGPEDANPSVVKKELQISAKENLATLSCKRKKGRDFAVVRRSERILNSISSSKNKEIVPLIEEIALSDGDKEDDPPAPEEDNHPELVFREMNLEEKVDRLFQLVQAQKDTIEALKSKVMNYPSSSESLAADMGSKTLYTESQKKIEALQEEKKQLALKLESALTKLEMYEKGTCIFSDALDKLKDAMLISNLTRATEAAMNLSSQAIRNAFSSTVTGQEPRPSSPKRKRTG